MMAVMIIDVTEVILQHLKNINHLHSAMYLLLCWLFLCDDYSLRKLQVPLPCIIENVHVDSVSIPPDFACLSLIFKITSTRPRCTTYTFSFIMCMRKVDTPDRISSKCTQRYVIMYKHNYRSQK